MVLVRVGKIVEFHACLLRRDEECLVHLESMQLFADVLEANLRDDDGGDAGEHPQVLG